MAWRDGVEAYTCSRATQLSRRPRWALGLCQHPRGAPQLAAALGTSLHPRPPGETRHTGGGGGRPCSAPGPPEQQEGSSWRRALAACGRSALRTDTPQAVR